MLSIPIPSFLSLSLSLSLFLFLLYSPDRVEGFDRLSSTKHRWRLLSSSRETFAGLLLSALLALSHSIWAPSFAPSPFVPVVSPSYIAPPSFDPRIDGRAVLLHSVHASPTTSARRRYRFPLRGPYVSLACLPSLLRKVDGPLIAPSFPVSVPAAVILPPSTRSSRIPASSRAEIFSLLPSRNEQCGGSGMQDGRR